MRHYGTRHRTWRSAVVIGMIASLFLAAFARPATAATTATTATTQPSTYRILVMETADAALTVGEIRRLAERAAGRSLPAPGQVWFADTGKTVPPRPQIDAMIAGQQTPGITVLRTVQQPSVDRTVHDLCAGLPDGTTAFWGFLIFAIIFIIKVIIDHTKD